jgi:glycosyltransferase involved in cell wall biosynthesis
MVAKTHLPKVIHIVENLDRGAVENWLCRMLAHAGARGQLVDWTFYCALGRSGAMDHQVKSLGAKIIHSPVPLGQPIAFIRALRAALQAGGYDVMHCHHDLVSAVYMVASANLPIRRRIVHVHNADEHLPTINTRKATLLREPMRRICLAADKVVGISNHTLDTFIAGRPRRQGREIVHYYGVKPEPFQSTKGTRAEFRRSLGFAEDALVMLFGGRMAPEKNPEFAVDVLAALVTREPRAVGVFAGAGSLEQAVRIRSVQLGISDRLRITGWRSDLPELMSASDWFILPRPEAPMEGFGLAIVEAQLAGLRLLISHGVPNDPLLPTAVFRRLALAEGPDVWADNALALLGSNVPEKSEVFRCLATSPMNMDYALDDLMQLHA